MARCPFRRARRRASQIPRDEFARERTKRRLEMSLRRHGECASRAAGNCVRSSARRSDRSASTAIHRRARRSRPRPRQRSQRSIGLAPCSGTSGCNRLRERRGIGDEVRVLVLEQRDAHRLRRGDAHARRMRACRRAARRAPARLPILRLSDSTNTGRAGSKRSSAIEQLRLERLLRRLRVAGKVAQQRAAVPRELLEVEHLRALVAQRGEQAALAGAGQAADDDEVEPRGQPSAAPRRRAGATSGSRRRAAPRASRFRSAHARANALRLPPRQQ